MGEVQYVWADPGSPNQQVALSSIVQAMTSTKSMAIARWVTRDGMDPKMGVLDPCRFDGVDCLLWAQVHSVVLVNVPLTAHDFVDALCGRRAKLCIRIIRHVD
jgi:Ku70/Ku80 beta-barrel domain